MRRLFWIAFAIPFTLIGCGGGGSGTVGGSGGGGVVTAGPLTLEGQISTPQGAVVSGVTTYVVSGNITRATLNDLSPTLDETEIFVTKDGANGYEITARNADGSGQPRSIVKNMPLLGFPMRTDPSVKYVYYIRNSNLQRTSLTDGTSNTILASVASFCFNRSGSKIVYHKLGTDELWTANLNGTGPALVTHYTNAFETLGCADDTSVGVRDGFVFLTIDLTNGNQSPTTTFSGFNFNWSACSPSDRSVCVCLSKNGRTYIYRSEVAPSGHQWYFKISLDTPLFILSSVSAGPEQNLVGLDNTTAGLKRFTTQGDAGYVWPPESGIYDTHWAANRLSWPLTGSGSSYPSGLGALICTELGKLTPSVVGVDAVTRSSIVVTSLNDTTVGNPLYRVDCDSLKTLAYANRNGYAWQTLVGAPAGIKGALVSFDANTGSVANIVTFTKKPVVTRQGRGWRVEGDLADVFAPSKIAKRPAGSSVLLQ